MITLVVGENLTESCDFRVNVNYTYQVTHEDHITTNGSFIPEANNQTILNITIERIGKNFNKNYKVILTLLCR